MLANARSHAEPVVLEYEKAPEKTPVYARPYPLYRRG
jgi:hypothetical protein